MAFVSTGQGEQPCQSMSLQYIETMCVCQLVIPWEGSLDRIPEEAAMSLYVIFRKHYKDGSTCTTDRHLEPSQIVIDRAAR